MLRNFLAAALVVGTAPVLLAQTAPSTAATQEAAPLRIVITGIEGIVQARASADQPWQKAAVDQELAEGAELRTGPRSAVRFVILPDQIVTLDRLGTLQILRANFDGNKIVTDLGMQYGRTRFDIDAQGRAHDAKVHSPSSVLAVRGTKVSLYDQPPFAPEAVSLTGRAMFQDVRKQVSFGAAGQGKTRVSQETETAAGFALGQTVADPRGQFSGRSETDNLLQLSLAAYGGADFSNLGVLAFLDQARAGNFEGSLIGALPIGRQLQFFLTWSGSPFSDVDLSIVSPRGEVVNALSGTSPTSGRHLGNGVADASGFGSEQVVWEISYPVGDYSVRAELKSGQTAEAQVFTIDDPLGSGQVISTISGSLNPRAPTVTGQVTATGRDIEPTPQRASASSRKNRTRTPRPPR